MQPGDAKQRTAFSLIELLVVVSIIALLVSMLLPALGRAREQAKKTICATNLHQYGVAIYSYAADNDGGIMSTPLVVAGDPAQARYPDFWFVKRPTLEGYRDMFNIENINPYIQAFEFSDKGLRATGLALCPSVSEDAVEKRVNQHYLSTAPANACGGGGHIMANYAYYARVDKWQACAFGPAPRELVARRLAGDRVIMSDVLSMWLLWAPYNTEGGWIYNHGEHGWSWLNYPGGYRDVDEVPALTGINRLFGDGRVEWKAAAQFDLANISHPHTGYEGGYIGYNGVSGAPFGFY